MARLDEITGCGIIAAQVAIAEIGLDMTVFGTAAGWSPGRNAARRPASPAKKTHAPPGKGNPWLNGILGEIAVTASRTDTFLGERYRRLARRRGKRKALAAIARSILVIIFHLLADPEARFRDLGPGYYDDPHRPGPQDPQPRPPARGPRPGRHHRPRRRRRLTHAAVPARRP